MTTYLETKQSPQEQQQKKKLKEHPAFYLTNTIKLVVKNRNLKNIWKLKIILLNKKYVKTEITKEFSGN